MSGPVRYLASLQARRRARGLVVIALVVGVVGAITVALVAGARRSSSVVDRYFSASTRYDEAIYAPGASRAQIAAIPGVARVDPDNYVALTFVAPEGTVRGGVNGMALDPASIDPTFQILRGRLADPARPDETVANEGFARQFGIEPGSDITVQALNEKRDAAKAARGIYEPTGPKYRFHIAGIVRTPDEIGLDQRRSAAHTGYVDANEMIVPDAFYEAHHHEFWDFPGNYDVAFVHPGDRAAVVAKVKQLPGVTFVAEQPPRFSERRSSFRTPVNLETLALWLLAVGLAVAGLVVVALLLRAEQRLHADDEPTLRAIGATTRELGLSAAARTMPAAVGGAMLAVAGAYLLSGRFPIGLGGELELAPGRNANVVVFLSAAATIVAVMTAMAYVFGRRTRTAGAVSRRRTIARRLGQIGAPTDLVTGTHLAFERQRGSRAMPTRAAIAGGAAALMLLVGIGVFVTSIDHLYATPSAHGWPWNIVVGNVNFDFRASDRARLVADPAVAAATAANNGQVTIGGRSVEVTAIDSAGSAPPIMLTGRVPSGPREIALGARLARELGVGTGDTVPFSIKDGEFALENRRPRDLKLRAVGIAIPPSLGESEFGDTGVVTLDAIRDAGGDPRPKLVFVRLRKGTDTTSFARRFTQEDLLDDVPARVANLHRVRPLPFVGGALAALLGTTLLVYTLLVGVRARRRELAVLRAIGMSARRLGRVLTWQGVAIGTVIVLLGIPLGIALGSLAWRTVAHDLGVADGPTFTPWIAALIPATIGAAILASLLPARRLRRDAIARTLSGE